MATVKTQTPLMLGENYILPLTTADQVVIADGTRLMKNGKITADEAVHAVEADKFANYTLDTLKAYMLDITYPVGSIYMSVNETSPASLFGGTWEQIKGRFLIGTGTPEVNSDGTSPGSYNYATGSKGGEAAHALTVEELASHTHGIVWASNGGNLMAAVFSSDQHEDTTTQITYDTVKSAGGNQAHNNMPPFEAVNMWKRVS